MKSMECDIYERSNEVGTTKINLITVKF